MERLPVVKKNGCPGTVTMFLPFLPPELSNKYTSIDTQLDDRRCGHEKFDFLFGLNSGYFICLFLLNYAAVYSWWLIRRYRDLGNSMVDLEDLGI